MKRGNPRPGQQQMPDRSDDTERLALKIKAAATKSTGEIREDEVPVLREARDAARKEGKEPGRVRKSAARAPK